MSVTIPAKRLWEMCYNTLLYTSKKSAAGPVVRWTMNCGGMFLTASDDYFIISDKYGFDGDDDLPGWEGLGQDGHDFWVSLESMKSLEKILRDTEGDTEILISETVEHLNLRNPEFEAPFETEVDELAWGHAAVILGMRDFIDQSDSGTGQCIFAIHPDRLRKLSLVKPGDYPIDCRYGWTNRYDRDVVHFKIGPTVRGVFAPLDREIITETFVEKGDVLW